ncbi:hypothetical protein JAAARDRAFT_197332 [Jaapia argillacea MUCL 33604]|uniref:C2H2-type domain-containing protein n=1 Tax=Jaapia argillacea MUCL 33604 TaxID=933084 RepID=A0A067PF47_9AGAM|nr:hypothetical protein JAAARDRAFT_197332 [Jaapia argillacea MUCL 33604]
MAWCDRCDRYFVSQHALEMHIANSSSHHYCSRCERDFTSPNALESHLVNSPNHNYCRECGDDFDDWQELDEHIEENHWHCDDCDMFFRNEVGLKEHYRQSAAHHYCGPCARHFGNANSLQNHLRSTIHVGRTLNCPGARCNKSFPSISALTLHLESDTCRSGMTRKKVNNLVKDIDTTGVITDRRLITAASNSRTTNTYATEAAWNGTAFECYFCARKFRTLDALNQHLRSPTHENQIYKCPHCQVKFVTLSGLVQHVESEKCGVLRFAMRVMEGLTAGLQKLLL